jgi:two-component system, chemotaxis family, chemotaxis protein CheY
MSARVLIVDDSGLARRLTRQFVEELGHSVEEATDGPQALERYVLNRHDIVILDMVMHGMYGLEVLHKLRELNPDVPVIVVTADIQKSTRDEVKASGAAAIIHKPLKRDELGVVLGTVLSGGTVWS